MTIEAFWQEFLNFAGLDESAKYRNSYFFDSNEQGATKLLNMVLSGEKTATTGAFVTYGDKLPQIGDYSIVTDWHGVPHCVIQTTGVTTMLFNEMTYEICDREGEYDSLEAWQEDHKRYFKEEGQEAGYEFSEDMPIVFRDFKMVFAKKQG